MTELNPFRDLELSSGLGRGWSQSEAMALPMVFMMLYVNGAAPARARNTVSVAAYMHYSSGDLLLL